MVPLGLLLGAGLLLGSSACGVPEDFHEDCEDRCDSAPMDPATAIRLPLVHCSLEGTALTCQALESTLFEDPERVVVPRLQGASYRVSSSPAVSGSWISLAREAPLATDLSALDWIPGTPIGIDLRGIATGQSRESPRGRDLSFGSSRVLSPSELESGAVLLAEQEVWELRFIKTDPKLEHLGGLIFRYQVGDAVIDFPSERLPLNRPATVRILASSETLPSVALPGGARFQFASPGTYAYDGTSLRLAQPTDFEFTTPP